MNRFKRSGRVMTAALTALRREKKLLLFPVIAFGLTLVIVLFFLGPVLLYPTGHSYFSAEHWQALGNLIGHSVDPSKYHAVAPATVSPGSGGMAPWIDHGWVVAFFAVIYFSSMILATFTNVAFYHEIMQVLNGGNASISRGYRFAASRWQAVLLWSVFAGLVGYLIQAIERRAGILGRIIGSLFGVAWSVACIFILPTLVRETETANPMRLLRSSVQTLQRTWGELVIGFVGADIAFGVIFLGLFLTVGLLTAGIVALFVHFGTAGWVIGVTIGVAVLGLFLAGVVLSWASKMVNAVYRSALYIYATEGVVPDAFDQELLDSAWKVKKG